MSASYPVFRKLSGPDLQKASELVFALASYIFTDDQVDFLFEIGTRFPTFMVGCAGDDVFPYIKQVLGRPPLSPAEIVVFNFDQMVHYDTSEFFTRTMLTGPFFKEQWVSAAVRLLTQIQNGDLKPAYISEPEPTEQPSIITKLVGTTYERFVMDETKDVIVMFKREECPHCEKFWPEVEDFAMECRESGLTFLKFGHIDVTKNSASLAYPYMPGVPHLHIFPAKNKTGGDGLRGGRDRDGIIRWLKKFATQEIPFEAAPLDKGKVAMEVFQVLMSVKDMPEDEQRKAMAYLQEMNDLFDSQKETKSEEL
jgi:hypothetical protein